jgi:hypothetical protein
VKKIWLPWLALLPMGKLAFATFESLLHRYDLKALFTSVIWLIVFWHIYTPIHELLHVAAAIMTGGSVSELALKPQYGGNLLQPIFPFIVPESDYAGQLTGFEVPNDFAYAFVDFLPYVLSIPGALLIVWAARRASTALFALGVILAFIPLMSIPGDYYEAVSLATTRIAHSFDPSLDPRLLVSDDVFKSIGDLSEAGLLTGANTGLIIVGILGAIYLALATLGLQWWLAEKVLGAEELKRYTQFEVPAAQKSEPSDAQDTAPSA